MSFRYMSLIPLLLVPLSISLPHLEVMSNNPATPMDQLAFMCYDDVFPCSGKLSIMRERLIIQSERITTSVDPKAVGCSFVCSHSMASDNGLMDSPWPMKCHDTRHTGRSPYSTSDNNGALLWRFRSDKWIEGGVVVDDEGVIYFGDFWGTLYAVYPDGSLKWALDLGPGRHIHQSSPAISSDGIVYVGVDINDTDGGEVVAVDPDGSICWRCFIANNWVESSPCIGEGGVVYIGSSWMNRSTGESYGYLYAFGHGNVPPGNW